MVMLKPPHLIWLTISTKGDSIQQSEFTLNLRDVVLKNINIFIFDILTDGLNKKHPFLQYKDSGLGI